MIRREDSAGQADGQELLLCSLSAMTLPFRKVKFPTLSHNAREEWGTLRSYCCGFSSAAVFFANERT
jgi:hypothetical protein